jgi:hypothetical protein
MHADNIYFNNIYHLEVPHNSLRYILLSKNSEPSIEIDSIENVHSKMQSPQDFTYVVRVTSSLHFLVSFYNTYHYSDINFFATYFYRISTNDYNKTIYGNVAAFDSYHHSTFDNSNVHYSISYENLSQIYLAFSRFYYFK